MGYKFQFVTLAGFHSLNLSMFKLARAYKDRGMGAYSELQQAEFARAAGGQREALAAGTPHRSRLRRAGATRGAPLGAPLSHGRRREGRPGHGGRR
jgi:isocitrate lyase